jgi:geranylgeranyl diphosphate synthase type I
MEPVAGYHAGWLDADGHPVTAKPGKAVRPTLVVLAAQATGATAQAAVPAAVAVELVHDFTLLQDDVMDGDATRRHRPAAWAALGTASAILGSDALLVAAFQVLQDASFSDPILAARVLASSIQRLIRGQGLDLDYETRADVPLADAVRMAADKTAALFAGACALGTLVGEASDPVRRAFADIGEELGLAYQLLDDLLGIWGDARTGKPVGADLRRHKKSLPVVAALRSGTKAADRLAELYATAKPSQADVKESAALIEEAGGRAWARQQADIRLESATRMLTDLGLPASRTSALLELISFVAARTS